MKFSITDFFSKCDQIRSSIRIWSHLLKISITENFTFCEVNNMQEKCATQLAGGLMLKMLKNF